MLWISDPTLDCDIRLLKEVEGFEKSSKEARKVKHCSLKPSKAKILTLLFVGYIWAWEFVGWAFLFFWIIVSTSGFLGPYWVHWLEKTNDLLEY